MDQQDKRSPGLHKEVSTIFDGVPLPNGEKASSASPSDQQSHGVGSPTAAQAIAGISTHPPVTPAAPKAPAFSRPFGPERARGVVKPISRRTDFMNRLLAKVVSSDLDQSVARRQKLMALLIPVLAVILVLVFVKMLGVPARTDAGVKRKAQQAGETEPEATSNKDVDWELPAVIPQTVRDPMKSDSLEPTDVAIGDSPETAEVTAADMDKERAEKLKNLQLTGILYSKDRPAAIVDTRIVHEGDTVFGAKVVRINPDSIELELDGRKWTQQLH